MQKMDIEAIKKRHDEDSKRLEELIASRRELREKLANEFKSNITKHFTPDEIEALEVAEAKDVVPMVLDKAFAYIQEEVDKHDAEIAEFKKVLDENNRNLESLNARERFMANHPDVDIDDFEEFCSYDILPRKMNELIELPIDKRLEAMLKLYNDAKGKKEEGAELPDDVDYVAGATGNIDRGEADSDNDDNFAENYGQNR